MGKHSDFMKATTGTLRRIAEEATANFVAAEETLAGVEDRENRAHQRDAEHMASKFSAIRNR